MNDSNSGTKRDRDDSEFDSPESKRFLVESVVNPPESNQLESDENSPELEQAESAVKSPELNRVDSDELDFELPVASRIGDDILDILDYADTVTDRDPTVQDLDSVIKSLEEEILHAPPPLPPSAVVEVSTDPGESRPELGFLLEASDDELGLPPAVSPSDEQHKDESSNLVAIPPEGVNSGETMGFENDIPSFDSFEFGMGDATHGVSDDGIGEFVTLGGLFDDYLSEPSDFSEFSLRPESSLPAL